MNLKKVQDLEKVRNNKKFREFEKKSTKDLNKVPNLKVHEFWETLMNLRKCSRI